MTRLRRTVDDQIEEIFLPPHALQRLAVPYVNVMDSKVSRALHETTKVPVRVALQTKKASSHVVVDANHRLRAQIEVADQLRSDQPTGARYEHLHCIILPQEVLASFHDYVIHYRTLLLSSCVMCG